MHPRDMHCDLIRFLTVQCAVTWAIWMSGPDLKEMCSLSNQSPSKSDH